MPACDKISINDDIIMTSNFKTSWNSINGVLMGVVHLTAFYLKFNRQNPLK